LQQVINLARLAGITYDCRRLMYFCDAPAVAMQDRHATVDSLQHFRAGNATSVKCDR
jgi:hypothetical protein